MKRHTITMGATTTAGGRVTSASSFGSIEGATIALEGDTIFCPACKNEGEIRCIGPRLDETWNGKSVALENDLCGCKCPVPPRLVPSQHIRYQLFEPAPNLDQTIEHGAPAAVTLFDDRFLLLDETTGAPMCGVEYGIRRASGALEFGVTDQLGHTHCLSPTSAAETVDLYL